MPVDQINQPEQKKEEAPKQNEPLLNINLPAPPDGNPRTPLTIGQHNAAAQHNFKKVADLFMALINNQRMLGSAIDIQQKQIKELQENNKTIAENIRKFIKENDNEQPNTTGRS